MWRYTWWAQSKVACGFRPGGVWTKQYMVTSIGVVLYLCGVRNG